MACSISGDVCVDPVVSLKSGHLFERALIEKQISATGRCPITDQELSKEDLLAVQTHKNQRNSVAKPRLTSSAGIPGMLKALQNEWDAIMLESYSLKKHLADVRQELAYALYQKDAACRVIARLIKERDQARAAIGDVRKNMAAAVGSSAESGMEVEDSGIGAEIVRKMQSTAKKLSNKARKTKVKGLQIKVASPADIKKYTQASKHSLHSSSKPGVLCLGLHPKSADLVISGGNDASAVIFNRATGKKVDTLKGHDKAVTDVLFHPTSNVVVTASADATAKIWTTAKRGKFQVQSVLGDHKGAVVSATLHPSGDYLVTASADASWCFWDLETSACKAKVTGSNDSGYTAASFHPDGLILGGATEDGVVRIFDVKQQKNVHNFTGHKAAISGLAFSENGYQLGSVDASGVVKMWDLRKLKNFHTMEIGSPLTGLTFDASGTYMAVTGKEASIYSVKGFELVKSFSGSKKPYTAARFGQDASFLATTGMDRTLKFYA